MLLAFALAAILLTSVGTAVYFYFDHAVAIFVTVTMLTFRRILSQLFWILIVVPVMPERLRHALAELTRRFRTWRIDAWEDVTTAWQGGTIFVRILISLGAALGSGFIAGMIIYSPGNVRRIPGIGPVLSETVMPYLMKTATVKSVEMHIPTAWRQLPARIRTFFWRPFRYLWWRTARRGLKTRQMAGRLHNKKFPIKN